MAGQLGMAPESVSRMVGKADREHKIPSKRLYQLADIFQCTVDELRRPPRPKDKPAPPSLDAMVADQPDEFKVEAAQILEMFLRQRRA